MWTNSSQKWSIHRYIFKLLPLRSQEELCVLLGTIRNVNNNLVTSNSENVLFSSGCSWCEVDSLFPYFNYFTDLFYFTLNYIYPSTLIKIYDCEHLPTIISTSNFHYKTNHGNENILNPALTTTTTPSKLSDIFAFLTTKEPCHKKVHKNKVTAF